ncbi:MAG: 3-deoxy-7-phosphoheptulonate synthase [Desulfatibacillaceae bacterium]
MLLVMRKGATEEQIGSVVRKIQAMGCEAREIPGGERVAIGILHNKGALDPSDFLSMPGVRQALPVTRPFKLVSREFHPEDTVVRVLGAKIGGGGMCIMAGPCAIESEKRALAIAEAVKAAGATMFRGGAYKPRTSPYSFQGLGEEGLKILAKVREETGLPVVTEAMDVLLFDKVEEYADVVQIGARNMQNFSLLRRAGQSRRPVLLKRGLAATIDEWLMAAEYIMEGGNSSVILCERGIRTFAPHSRNTLDLSAIPVVRRESHLPVITDPSHAGGHREQVLPLALASTAVGVDGLMIEVHNEPDKALSDGGQSLYPEQFAELVRQTDAIHELVAHEKTGDAVEMATAS